MKKKVAKSMTIEKNVNLDKKESVQKKLLFNFSHCKK